MNILFFTFLAVYSLYRDCSHDDYPNACMHQSDFNVYQCTIICKTDLCNGATTFQNGLTVPPFRGSTPAPSDVLQCYVCDNTLSRITGCMDPFTATNTATYCSAAAEPAASCFTTIQRYFGLQE